VVCEEINLFKNKMYRYIMNVDLLNFDIFTNVLKYLDFQDIKHFLLTNKMIYNYYKFNRVYVGLLITRSIENMFGINYKIRKEDDKLDDNGIMNISIIYNRIYNQFKMRRCVNFTDIIIYLVENKYDDSIYILRKIVPMCILRGDSDYISSNVITFGDMTYLIVYSDENEIDILLKNFIIPISIINYSLQEILYKIDKTDNIGLKVYKIIDYIHYKYCFGKLDYITDMYMHMILVNFIKYRQSDFVKYFLVKKRIYKTTLVYQTLINECLLSESMESLKMIIKEMESDSKLLKIYVIIDRDILEKISRRGSFYVIKYVIDNLMGNFININGYVKSICNGIERYNGRNFSMYFRKLQILEGYFNDRSKKLINDCLRGHVRNKNEYVLV
jgi:hypothetical protein